MNTSLHGIPVFQSALAVSVSWKWEVRKHPTNKRRRRWAAVRVKLETPCALQTPLGLFLHPVLFAQLRKQEHDHSIRP